MSAAAFETVIGLEVHVQLATRSKMFCGCAVAFAGDPNTRTCPVCAGHPGALPVPNAHAVHLGLRAALALGCTIAQDLCFDRKNYFYPDLPKGYQISQFARPLGRDGGLALATGPAVRIERIHLEEDAGKNLHGPAGSLLDLNRAGVPLAEIVTHPDLRSPAQAHAYLTALKQVLRYAQVSECDLEKGSLRCDANVSVRRAGDPRLGTKVEIKNLNSFKMVEKAIEYEATRQAVELSAGRRIVQETRLWSDDKSETRSLRSKEHAHDYRYFPDPDIPARPLDPALVAAVRRELPEAPAARRARFVSALGLSPGDAEVLTAERAVADYFEAVAQHSGDAKAAANWVMGEVLHALHGASGGIEQFPIPPAALAELLARVKDGTVNHMAARRAFAHMHTSGATASAAIQALGLEQLSDRTALEAVVRTTLEQMAGVAADYKAGKRKALDALKGAIMRATRGKANPAVVAELLEQLLK